MSDLTSVMQYIGERYIFTSEHYPILSDLSAEQMEAFAVSHSVHHMIKSLGKISAECETFDHGGQLHHEVLEEATVKMFINTLKLAEELGMSAEDLCERVPQVMRSK